MAGISSGKISRDPFHRNPAIVKKGSFFRKTARARRSARIPGRPDPSCPSWPMKARKGDFLKKVTATSYQKRPVGEMVKFCRCASMDFFIALTNRVEESWRHEKERMVERSYSRLLSGNCDKLMSGDPEASDMIPLRISFRD